MTTLDNVNLMIKSSPSASPGEHQPMDDKMTKNYICPCSEVFYECPKFIEHAKTCHIFDMAANNFLNKPPSQTLKCLECGQSLANEYQLIQHCHTEHNKIGNFNCPACDEKFCNLAKFLVHKMLKNQCCIGSKTQSQAEMIRCNLCQKTGFRHHSELLYHLNSCPANNSGSTPTSTSDLDPKGQELLRRASMILNQQQKTPETTQANSGTSNNTHIVSDASRPFRCDHCVKSFKSKALLDQHMHIHFPPKYTCRYCSKKYRWPPVFYHHQRTCKKRLQPPNTVNGPQASSSRNGTEARMRRNRNPDNNAPNMLLQQLQNQGIIQPPTSNTNQQPPLPMAQGKAGNVNYLEMLMRVLPQSQQGNLMNLLLTATTLGMKFPPFLPPPPPNNSGQMDKNNLFGMMNSHYGKQKMSSEPTPFQAEDKLKKTCSNCKRRFDELSTFLIHITTCRPSYKPEMPTETVHNPFLSMMSAFGQQQEETTLPPNFPLNPAQFLNQIEENRRLIEAQQSTNNSSSSSCGDPLSKSPPKTPEFVDEDYFNSIQPMGSCTEAVLCQFCGQDFPAKSALRQHFEECHAGMYQHKCDTCNKRFRWGPGFSYHKKMCPEQSYNSPFQLNSSKFMANNLASYDFDTPNKKDESSSDPDTDHNRTSFTDDSEFKFTPN